MKILTLDELYDIFDTNQYDEFRSDFKDDVFIHRKNPNTPTLATGILCLGGKVPIVYQHIIAERLFAASFDSIDWQEMDAYEFMTLLSLVYLWMYPLTFTEEHGEGQITFEGRIVREMYNESRLEKVWDRANKLFESGVLFFADELPLCPNDDIELGMLNNTHFWEYITANVLEVTGKILQKKIGRQERWEECRMLHSNALRYSIMFIKEHRGGKAAASILRLLQNEWSDIKTWKAMGIVQLDNNEILQFEDSLFHGFEKDLEMWDAETSENVSNKPFLSTDRAIRAVYEAQLCESADWAAVVKILEEQGKWPKSAFSYAANYINNVCGQNVTAANSIARSIIYTRVKGTYPNWEIKEEERSREAPNKLNMYLKIGDVFVKAQKS